MADRRYADELSRAALPAEPPTATNSFDAAGEPPLIDNVNIVIDETDETAFAAEATVISCAPAQARNPEERVYPDQRPVSILGYVQTIHHGVEYQDGAPVDDFVPVCDWCCDVRGPGCLAGGGVQRWRCRFGCDWDACDVCFAKYRIEHDEDMRCRHRQHGLQNILYTQDCVEGRQEQGLDPDGVDWGFAPIRIQAAYAGVTLPPTPDYLREHGERSLMFWSPPDSEARIDWTCDFCFNETSGGDKAIFAKTRISYRKMCNQKMRRAELRQNDECREQYDAFKRRDRERKAEKKRLVLEAMRTVQQPNRLVWM
jgi:hypothetical protein